MFLSLCRCCSGGWALPSFWRRCQPGQSLCQQQIATRICAQTRAASPQEQQKRYHSPEHRTRTGGGLWSCQGFVAKHWEHRWPHVCPPQWQLLARARCDPSCTPWGIFAALSLGFGTSVPPQSVWDGNECFCFSCHWGWWAMPLITVNGVMVAWWKPLLLQAGKPEIDRRKGTSKELARKLRIWGPVQNGDSPPSKRDFDGLQLSGEEHWWKGMGLFTGSSLTVGDN